jgi:hypothetical protein
LLTPEQRSQRARAAALARWAKEDPAEHTARMRAVGVASVGYWVAKVCPDGGPSPDECLRRATAAKRAHYTRMAYLSSRARSRVSDKTKRGGDDG